METLHSLYNAGYCPHKPVVSDEMPGGLRMGTLIPWPVPDLVNALVRAVITNTAESGWLKQKLIPHSLEALSPRSGCQQVGLQ